MTTIACKDGVIAYDSRITAGTTITDDDYNKHTQHGGVDFFLTGCIADFEKFYAAYDGEPINSDIRVCGFAVVCGDLWQVAYNQDDKFWKIKLSHKKVYAAGSGASHALTAMDMGASAADAVRMAIKRDNGSGGKVNEYKVGV